MLLSLVIIHYHQQKMNDIKTDGFLIPSITLRKLQQLQTIPPSEKLLNLDSPNLSYRAGKKGFKYLLLSKSNKIYYGEVNKNGQPEDKKGVVIFQDGSYYEGRIVQGKFQGKGKLTNLQSSFSYEGDWKHSQPHGQGVQLIGTNKFEGEFMHGKKHGFGKLFYGDDSKYEGNFVNGKIEGQGKYFNKNHFWEGQWQDGYLQGKGKQIIAKKTIEDLTNSSKYEGDFVRGERSGYGNFNWNGKYEYEGEFKNGQLDGEGIFQFKGKVYGGTWKKGTEIKINELKKGAPNKKN